LGPLKELHADPVYIGDLHRADMAWAKHANVSGLTLGQIMEELVKGRDLSKKGQPQAAARISYEDGREGVRSV
jgi:hypothetical protein